MLETIYILTSFYPIKKMYNWRIFIFIHSWISSWTTCIADSNAGRKYQTMISSFKFFLVPFQLCKKFENTFRLEWATLDPLNCMEFRRWKNIIFFISLSIVQKILKYWPLLLPNTNILQYEILIPSIVISVI